jgi:hypothetical protein
VKRDGVHSKSVGRDANPAAEKRYLRLDAGQFLLSSLF